MPLVQIDLPRTQAPKSGRAIGDAVHDALIDALDIPPDDHFQIIARAQTLVFDESYLGIKRSEDFLIIRIHLARGRTLIQKQALYARIAELLAERCATRPEDVFVNLVEVGAEDFSFGCGIAQYATALPPHLTPTPPPGGETQLERAPNGDGHPGPRGRASDEPTAERGEHVTKRESGG